MARTAARARSGAERQAGRALEALGSPTRRAILRLLVPGARTVGGIAEKLPVSRPAVSKHLRILEGAGLVATERRGVTTVVRLERAGFDAARRWLEEFWDEALARFATLAEEGER